MLNPASQQRPAVYARHARQVWRICRRDRDTTPPQMGSWKRDATIAWKTHITNHHTLTHTHTPRHTHNPAFFSTLAWIEPRDLVGQRNEGECTDKASNAVFRAQILVTSTTKRPEPWHLVETRAQPTSTWSPAQAGRTNREPSCVQRDEKPRSHHTTLLELKESRWGRSVFIEDA